MECIRNIKKEKACCNNTDCNHWISYEKDQNCCLISIERNGKMTLQQVAERLGVSYVRIKQIEDKAIDKLKKITEME